MRIHISSDVIYDYKLTLESRSLLEQVYPEGFRGGGFWVTLFADDPRAPKVREALDLAGLHHRAPGHTYPIEQTYLLSRVPVFEHAELAAAPYIELPPTTRITSSLAAYHKIVVDPRDLDEKPTFVQAWYAIVIRDSTRLALESQRFKKLKFGETMPGRFDHTGFHTRMLDWSKFGEPWWELMSEAETPRGHFAQELEAYLPKDAPWDSPMDGRLHFTESDVRSLGEFDIACGSEGVPYIVSQRFYQFCKAQGWNAEWRPVAIDPE